ncbi:hypothetical protein NUKP71_46930 [Klebsiella quasipneumoniae]|nr:hypothetical protein NUKP71_46930 [Klebsiella quasipneumoniae]
MKFFATQVHDWAGLVTQHVWSEVFAHVAAATLPCHHYPKITKTLYRTTYTDTANVK